MRTTMLLLVLLMLACSESKITSEPELDPYADYNIGDIWDVTFEKLSSGVYTIIGYTTKDANGVYKYYYKRYTPSMWLVDTLAYRESDGKTKFLD